MSTLDQYAHLVAYSTVSTAFDADKDPERSCDESGRLEGRSYEVETAENVRTINVVDVQI